MAPKLSLISNDMVQAPHPLRSQPMDVGKNKLLIDSSIESVIDTVLGVSDLLRLTYAQLKEAETELEQLKLVNSKTDVRLKNVESELAEQTQRAENAEKRVRELEDKWSDDAKEKRETQIIVLRLADFIENIFSPLREEFTLKEH